MAKGKVKVEKGSNWVHYPRKTAPRLKQIYKDQVRESLRKSFRYANLMQVPCVAKISINMGLGRATAKPKLIESAVEELKLISGQLPVVSTAKKDIAGFKLRKGQKIGCMVTLRGHSMWEFLDRFMNIALPRVRDFRGVSDRAFDGRGNYSCGIKEHIIFPEIDYDKVDEIKGMNVTIITTAQTDEEARALLRHLGMPFRDSTSAAQAAA